MNGILSRWLPGLLWAALGGAALLPAAGSAEAPVAVFAELDGRWAGTFAGYDESGLELYRIAVEQSYRTVDAHTQEVRIRDRMADGTVITGEGENRAPRRADGSLDLSCEVRKSNGERVVHRGRLIEGIDGHRHLVWYSRSPDRVETFREVVRDEGGAPVYEIQGMGRYGESLILMHGRYRKVGEAVSEPLAERSAEGQEP